MRRGSNSHFAILLLAASLPYGLALFHPFVYDDHGQIAENTFLQNPRNLLRVLTLDTLDEDRIVNGRRPAVVFSYFIDRLLWKDRPGGYRLTNLLLHLGVVFLLYGLLRRLIRPPDRETSVIPLAASLVFSLHPALIEAVHVPSFRPDVLYGLFTLVSLHAVLGLREAPTPRRRIVPALAGWGAIFLAAASKETALMAPVLLAGLWWFFPEARPRPRAMAIYLAGTLGVLAGFAALCAGGESFQAATGPWNGVSLRVPENLWTAPWLWVRYLGLMVWPANLGIDRAVPAVASWFHPRCLAGLAALGMAAAAVLALRKTRPLAGFGLFWMLAVYAPVSNLLPLYNPFAERYAYFMVPGFALLVAEAMAAWRARAPSGGSTAAGLFLAVCLILAALTAIRLLDFRSEYRLWQRAVETDPGSARAHTWLGIELKAAKQFDQALAHFETAARLNPEDVSPLINRGIIYGQRGDLNRAAAEFREAATRKPDSAGAHWNLAATLMRLGRREEAVREIDETLNRDPNHLPALNGKLTLLLHAGRKEESLQIAEKILSINPDDVTARQAMDRLRRE